jgi:two-component system sensor histidine kinase YesM
MRWKTWNSRFSIKVKLIFVLLAVCLSSILLMGGVTQSFYAKAAREDFFKFGEDATDRLNRQIEVYFQQLKLSVSSMVAGPLPPRSSLTRESENVGIIQRWLRTKGPLNPVQIADIEDVLNNYVALNYQEVDSLFLVALDERVISNKQLFAESGYELEPWFGHPLSSRLEILSSHKSQTSGNNVISLLVPIIATDSMQLAGRLVINLALSELEKTMVRSTLADKGYFFIVANNGTIVYHPQKINIGRQLKDTELAGLKLEQTSSVQKLNKTEMLVAYSESKLTEWKIVAMVPFEEMASGITIARNSMLVAMLILSAAILILVPIVAQRFTRPLRQLKRLMVQVEKGNLDVAAEAIPGNDEIQLLNLSFNRMTDQLRQLIDTVGSLKLNEMHIRLRQKEATIQALQNQINPHLLYNTLEIINSLAYVENNERIQIVAKNLGDYYRYNASIIETEVTLREELTQLSKYLEIVKIRFPKHFQSQYYVNEKFLDVLMIKCCLQPIIENAVKYAIEPKLGKGSVLVNAYDENDDLIIEVADNGPGMKEIKRLELQEKLERISSQAGGEFIKSESLGIVNVHARLVLQYGARYGLSFSSFEGRGTVVSVRIPMRR